MLTFILIRLLKTSSRRKENILVICPGFSSDCVETLEEISIQGKETSLEKGGKNFEAVSCLNDNEDHINLLLHLTNKFLSNKYEYLLIFQINTFNSCYILDGWITILTKNFCLSC